MHGVIAADSSVFRLFSNRRNLCNLRMPVLDWKAIMGQRRVTFGAGTAGGRRIFEFSLQQMI
jgi:hypothetical protein